MNTKAFLGQQRFSSITGKRELNYHLRIMENDSSYAAELRNAPPA
jgi:hypothetical protein